MMPCAEFTPTGTKRIEHVHCGSWDGADGGAPVWFSFPTCVRKDCNTPLVSVLLGYTDSLATRVTEGSVAMCEAQQQAPALLSTLVM